ncbi:hypothetical protein, partial [Paenibacillus xylanexedens]|uniref:hypothetical protein n=1 Tax=Paenibacillus xylanexedens TaxID=528191 RepID=UPI001C92E4E0
APLNTCINNSTTIPSINLSHDSTYLFPINSTNIHRLKTLSINPFKYHILFILNILHTITIQHHPTFSSNTAT